MNFQAVLALPKTAGSTQTNKSISSLELFGALCGQRFTYRVLQTIQMKLILLCVWAEWAVLGSDNTALRFKYEI